MEPTIAFLIASLIFCCECVVLAESPAATSIEFNRDIRPILSDHCFPCHGPDQAKRQAELRLDLETDAKATMRIWPQATFERTPIRSATC